VLLSPELTEAVEKRREEKRKEEKTKEEKECPLSSSLL
jgi:hypothetical protein